MKYNYYITFDTTNKDLNEPKSLYKCLLQIKCNQKTVSTRTAQSVSKWTDIELASTNIVFQGFYFLHWGTLNLKCIEVFFTENAGH